LTAAVDVMEDIDLNSIRRIVVDQKDGARPCHVVRPENDRKEPALLPPLDSSVEHVRSRTVRDQVDVRSDTEVGEAIFSVEDGDAGSGGNEVLDRDAGESSISGGDIVVLWSRSDPPRPPS
jgi:hypothetical protein